MEASIKKIMQLIIFAFIVKGLGFLREILLAYFYGTSVTSDVFIASLNIPSVIFALFGTAITTAYIPLFSEIKVAEGEKAALKFTNNVLNILTIISFGIAILGIVFSDILVKIFAGGFTGQAYDLCNHFVKITMITIVMTVVQYIYNGFLQTKGSFNQQSLMNIPYNVILIGTIVLSFYCNNFYILAVGAVFASFSQLIYLRVLIKRSSFRHKMVLDFSDSNIKKMCFLIAPVFVSTAINQINNIVDRNLASRLQEGSIAALNYSNKVNSIILEVVIMSIATIAYPMLSSLFAQENREKINSYIIKLLSFTGTLVLPISCFIALFSSEIVEILYGRGAFGSQEIEFVAKALKITAFGLIGSAFRDILNRVYYAMQDTITPVRNGIISVICNIVLNLCLVREYGYLGLAFATMFSANLCTILLLIQLFRKKRELRIKPIIVNYVKVFIATCLTYIVAYFIKKYIIIDTVLGYVFVNSIIIVIIYFILGLLMHETVCRELLLRWRNKNIKRK